MITVWTLILLIVFIIIIPLKLEYLYDSHNGVNINLYIEKIFNIRIKINKKKKNENVVKKIKKFYDSIKSYNENKSKYKQILKLCYLDSITIEYKVNDIYSYVLLNGFIGYIDNEFWKMFNNVGQKRYDVRISDKNEGFVRINIYFRLSYFLFLLIYNFKILSVITFRKKKGDVVGTIN